MFGGSARLLYKFRAHLDAADGDVTAYAEDRGSVWGGLVPYADGDSVGQFDLVDPDRGEVVDYFDGCFHGGCIVKRSEGV